MKLLTITIKCPGNDGWLFDDTDMHLDIVITNASSLRIGFPLEFLQRTGPSVRLVDTRTKAEAYLKNNLASFDLREKFTVIQPRDSVVVKWVITSGEIQWFRSHHVDLNAEITVAATIDMNGEKQDFLGMDTVRIVSRPKP